MLWLDLETRSQVDLIKHGLMRYAQHPSTQIISMAYAFDDEPVEFWWGWYRGRIVNDQLITRFPEKVAEYIKSDGPIFAHNADFERALFDYVVGPDYNFDAPALTQWRCTMALALASGFGAALDTATKNAGVPYRKNPAGARLIKEYCAPDHADIFAAEVEEDREIMKLYNMGDVECMRALAKCCRDFTDAEWEEYHLTCRTNERGIPIDTVFADQALGYANEVAADADAHIRRLTNGAMTKHTQRKARDEWLLPKLTDEQLNSLVVYKKDVKKMSLDADHRQILLNYDDLDHHARELMERINEAGSAALKKYSVAHHQNIDGRVFNTFLWNGAGRTGRYSGKGLQPHNIRRDVYDPKKAQCLIQKITRQSEVDNPAEVLARLARAMIKSDEGLYWVDWSAIEGRVAPWLANSGKGEVKLDLYREQRDIYIVAASRIFDVPEGSINKANPYRQAGKIAELSLQFGGARNALQSMAKNYGIVFEDLDASEVVRKWRGSNPWAEDIWRRYQRAVNAAVRAPGTDNPVGRVTYHSDGERFLWCELPSERLLAYPFPRWENYLTPWGEERTGATFQTHFKPPAGEEPLRNHARGALLFQNTVQAVAADILREALLEADDAGLDIIGHVHDEIIGQGGEEDGKVLDEIMNTLPWWAKGLPINTGGVSAGKRYGK